MSRFRRLSTLAAAILLTASSAHATFHVMSITELMVGIGGDPDAQYVELRLEIAGQNSVNNTRLTAFNADGTVATIVKLSDHSVVNGQMNRRILYATSNFTTLTGLTPDFTIPSGIISPTSGMVCWGAPSQIAVPPPTWDPTNPNNYIDCVAYGNYTGPTRGGAPTLGASGTPTALPPGDGTNALTRIAGKGQMVGSNATDFALRPPGPCINAAASCNVNGCPSAGGQCGLVGCNNGNVDTGEACDDGNATDGDGCEDDCALTPTPQQRSCRRGIAQAASKFSQAYAKATAACDTAVLTGKIPGPCPDQKTTDKIAKAEAGKIAAIAKACTGVTVGGAGFPASCPGIDATCGAALATIDDVTSCVDCAHEQAITSFETTLFGGFAGGQPSALKCQQAIAKSFNKLYAAAVKGLAKCEDADLLDKIPGPCPNGDTFQAYVAALNKTRAAVCKACGGSDKTCDGNGDVVPADIGITACPAVDDETVDCSAISVTSVDQLNGCLGCVVASRAKCADAVTARARAVPAYCDPVP
jgi:cysteine-rich repeat protein